jgi:hypothetical protein
VPQSAACVASATTRMGATLVLGVAGAMAGGWPGENIEITKRSQFYFCFSCVYSAYVQCINMHTYVKNQLASFGRKWLRLGYGVGFHRMISMGKWSSARTRFKILELRFGGIPGKSVLDAVTQLLTRKSIL